MTNTIKISLSSIKSYNPCASSWKKGLALSGKKEADYELFPFVDVLDNMGLQDALWCLKCLPEHDSIWREYTLWCARQAVRYTENKEEADKFLTVVEQFYKGTIGKAELTEAVQRYEAVTIENMFDAAETTLRVATTKTNPDFAPITANWLHSCLKEETELTDGQIEDLQADKLRELIT